MDDDNYSDEEVSTALQKLLFKGSETKIQVLYVTLDDGRQHLFLGSPLHEDDYDKIADFSLGETIDPVLYASMTSLFLANLTSH